MLYFPIYFLFKTICALHGNSPCTVFHMIMASVFSPWAFIYAALIYYFYVWAVMKSSDLVLYQHNPKDYHIQGKSPCDRRVCDGFGFVGILLKDYAERREQDLVPSHPYCLRP